MREAREMRNVSVIGGGCVGRGATLRFAWAGGRPQRGLRGEEPAASGGRVRVGFHPRALPLGDRPRPRGAGGGGG